MQNQNFSWINNNLKAKNDFRYGKKSKGVFAKNTIPKGEVLAVFGGHVYDLTKKSELAEVINGGDFPLQISDKLVIGVTKREHFSDTDFFNHSCSPNAGIKGQIFLISMSRIMPGEEVTFDYAMVLQNMPGVDFYSMDCTCGKKLCRKKITEDDWKIQSLQKKYNGFFNIFIQQKIDKLRK